jgi:type VI secretion system protein ImpC
MINKISMGVGVMIDTNTKEKTSTPTSSPGNPFCIAILGDFSGRGNRSQNDPETLSRRRLIEIDRDNFEQVMARFEISLNLSFTDNDTINIDIKQLDDFHPDELYEKLETFSKLRSLRRRLKNNSSFAEAAAEIQGWSSVNEAEESPAIQVASPTESDLIEAVQADAGNFLDSILDSQQQNSSASSGEATQIDRLIKSVVAPYVIPAADPRQDEMISSVDQATQTHMRDILHHADFQALESTWQSLYFLIRRLETDSKLKIKILDVTKQELQADLAVDDMTSTAIYKLFCDSAEGDSTCSVLLGNYSFTDSIDDVLSLAGIGAIAQQLGAPFIAAANETLVGCESFAGTPDYEDWNYQLSDGMKNAWQMLRQSPVAAYIGLALPRFLLRLPYGKKTKPIDSFAFEEMSDEPCHASYLWGNAAFIKVELLARSFKKHGWQMQPGEEFQTDNLPVHYYEEDGETISKPVAEILLTQKGGEIISQQGMMPLWSVKNRDCIRSSDFRSVAENGQTIVGRWVS